jgi:hypothetical protein
VPLLDVFDAASPLGALGTVVQLALVVVTEIEELCAPVPTESVAATVKV